MRSQYTNIGKGLRNNKTWGWGLGGNMGGDPYRDYTLWI